MTMDFTHIAFWHWWVAAAVLAILEMVMPGTMLLWFAVSAGVVGLITMIVPAIPWQAQFVVFAAISIATIYVWRRYATKNPEVADTDSPMLNKRADQYVGRTVVVTEPIVNGQGKAKVDDTVWRVTGPDAAVGERVKIVGADGAFLKVDKA